MSPPIQYNSSAVNASDCISKGWSLISPNLILYIGMFLVVFVITFLVGLIPYAGAIINLFLSGPLTCGILIAMLAKYRGEEPNFSMLFEGFNRFVPAVLISLIQALPWFILGLFAAGYMVAFKAGFPVGGSQGGTMPQFDPKILVPLAIIYFVTFLISIILKVLFIFALPLVADRNLGVVDAVKYSFQASANNLGGIILLVLLEILIALGGMLLCIIGLFVAVPLIYAAEIIAYKQVFPDTRQFFNNEPPQPEAYGGNYGFGQ